MHYPLTDIQTDVEINIGLLHIELPRKEIISTDGRTDVRQHKSFFQKNTNKKHCNGDCC